MTFEEFYEIQKLYMRIDALRAEIRDLENECNKIILRDRKETDHE
jgi:hypothetical protein